MVETQIFDIDMSRENSYVDNLNAKSLIINGLKRHRLFQKDCLYSFCDGAQIEQLLKSGNYRGDGSEPNMIFSLTKQELLECFESKPETVEEFKTLCGNYEPPAIAIYNRNHFLLNEFARWAYDFKNPQSKSDSLRGIARLVW